MDKMDAVMGSDEPIIASRSQSRHPSISGLSKASFSSSASSSAASSGFARIKLLDDDQDPFFANSSTPSSSLATSPRNSPSPSPSPNALNPTSATLSFAVDILAAEARALHEAMMRLSTDKGTARGFESAITAAIRVVEEEGKLVWCGVGKSGLIARKLCATALSLGISSVFLHPTEALHGDLGLVHKKDAVMLLSYSGGSSEVTELMPHIAARGASVIAFCGNPESNLVKTSVAWIDCRMPALNDHTSSASTEASKRTEGEAWGEVPAPSSTTTLSLAMGDALIFALARELGKGKRDFALNHPNGALGKAMREEGYTTTVGGG